MATNRQTAPSGEGEREGGGIVFARDNSGSDNDKSLRLLRKALRLRWEIPESVRERAIRVLGDALDADSVALREKLFAIRALATLDEIDRRRDRDDADRMAGQERLNASITSSLLETPEGRAELLRRREAAYAAHDALELRQHEEEAIPPADAASVDPAPSSQQQTPSPTDLPSLPAPVARDATADNGKFSSRSKRKRPRTG